nr:hypothetical protein [Tanacetum cinerariifolium]
MNIVTFVVKEKEDESGDRPRRKVRRRESVSDLQQNHKTTQTSKVDNPKTDGGVDESGTIKIVEVYALRTCLINETSASSLAPLTPEEIKADKIVLSWILFTLFDSLHAMIVVACAKSAKEAGALHVNHRIDEIKVKGKSWKPCFNFDKGSCYFGDSCRYVHDANARVSNANSGFNKGRGTSENMAKLVAQLGHLGMNVAMSNNGTNVTLLTHYTVTPTVNRPNISSNLPTAPHDFYASPCTSLGPNSTPLPGFPILAQAHVPYYGYISASTPVHLIPPADRPVHTTIGSVLSY